ncbi:class I SAM-dependent methyltransferase [Zhongshania sp.]|uniref:class I SAM-dependent methyltransferase n=1 Tax=Zhongshania sp. TaxID=1971902 RepID=UPI00356563A8
MTVDRDPVSSKAKWNLRHEQREMPGPACRVLRAHRDLLPANGLALDLACGLGGNAILLAQAGLKCEAMDISDVAVSRLNTFAGRENLAISACLADVEAHGFSLAPKQYDVIVVSYFLHRPLFPAIVSALKLGGLLFYQTFVQNDAGAQSGPKTLSFYLRERELLSQFRDLEIRYYDERANDNGGKASFEAELVAQKTNAIVSLG